MKHKRKGYSAWLWNILRTENQNQASGNYWGKNAHSRGLDITEILISHSLSCMLASVCAAMTDLGQEAEIGAGSQY